MSDHIDQIRLTAQGSSGSPGFAGQDSLPERATNVGLQECKDSLALTTAKLEKHMQDLMDQLITKSKKVMNSEEDIAGLSRLRDEWDTARQCMDICSKADHRLKDNISIIDNYATGDALQYMVSTDGTIIHGKNRGLGWRTRQVGGHLSDASLQQISRDMTSNGIRNAATERLPSRDDTPSAPNDGAATGPNPEFRERYGPGFKLASTSIKATPSTSFAESGY